MALNPDGLSHVNYTYIIMLRIFAWLEGYINPIRANIFYFKPFWSIYIDQAHNILNRSLFLYYPVINQNTWQCLDDLMSSEY
jgi:hypothetical protein